MSLSESELNEIREEAQSIYQYKFFTGVGGQWPDYTYNSIMEEKRKAYIAALTSERLKSKVLVEALEKINEAPNPYNQSESDTWISVARNICYEALDSYMNKKDI